MKNRFLIVAALIMFAQGSLLAKNAKDFTVKDPYGKTHNLFSHLDNGQYVLLYFAKKV